MSKEKFTPFKTFQLVIGCGQCGEMFASSFEKMFGWYSIALNFNKDTDRIEEHTKIIEKGGTGRKKDLGRKWFREHEADITEFIEEHIVKFKKEYGQTPREILLVAGESGGAGSSIAEELRKYFYKKPDEYSVFQLSIMPSQDEGVYFRSESLKSLKLIRDELKNKQLKGSLIVSNEYASKILDRALPPNESFNEGVLQGLLNIVYCVNNPNLDFSDSHKYPDFGDFQTVLHLPKEIFKDGNGQNGFLDVIAGDFQDRKVTFNSMWHDSVDLSSAKAYFGVLTLPTAMKGDKDFINGCFSSFDKATKGAIPFKITQYSDDVKGPHFRALVSGCNISKKLIKEIDDISKSTEKFKVKSVASSSTEDDVFSKL